MITGSGKKYIFIPVFLLRRYLKYHRERNNETKGFNFYLLSKPTVNILVVNVHGETRSLSFLYGSDL